MYGYTGKSEPLAKLVFSIHQYWGVGPVGDQPSEWVIGGQLGSIGGAGW